MVITNVGKAPAALNFAADQFTDWLLLKRSWSPQWHMLLFEEANKKHSVNHYAVVVVKFWLVRVPTCVVSEIQCSWCSTNLGDNYLLLTAV